MSEVSVICSVCVSYLIQGGVGDDVPITIEEMEVDATSEVCGFEVYFCQCICYQNKSPEFRGTLTLTISKVKFQPEWDIIYCKGWMENHRVE